MLIIVVPPKVMNLLRMHVQKSEVINLNGESWQGCGKLVSMSSYKDFSEDFLLKISRIRSMGFPVPILNSIITSFGTQHHLLFDHSTSKLSNFAELLSIALQSIFKLQCDVLQCSSSTVPDDLIHKSSGCLKILGELLCVGDNAGSNIFTDFVSDDLATCTSGIPQTSDISYELDRTRITSLSDLPPSTTLLHQTGVVVLEYEPEQVLPSRCIVNDSYNDRQTKASLQQQHFLNMKTGNITKCSSPIAAVINGKLFPLCQTSSAPPHSFKISQLTTTPETGAVDGYLHTLTTSSRAPIGNHVSSLDGPLFSNVCILHNLHLAPRQFQLMIAEVYKLIM